MHAVKLQTCLLIAVLAACAPAAAQSQDDSEPDAFTPVGPVDYVITGVAIGSVLVFETAVDGPSEPNWTGGILLDDGARSLMRLHTSGGRNTAAFISDMGFYSMMAYAVIIDPIVISAGSEPELAYQLLIMHLEAIAVTGALSRPGQKLAGRERPFAHKCEEEPDYHKFCGGSLSPESFISGHTAVAFGGAAAMCETHSNTQPYGSTGDTITCIAGLSVATLTGVLRMSADMHYFSDVLLGSGIGLAVGFLLPRLLHFNVERPADRAMLMPFATETEFGLRYRSRY